MQAIILTAQSKQQPALEVSESAQPKAHVQDIAQAIQVALSADEWFKENQNTLRHRDGLAWKGSKIYVPRALRLEVLQCCHNARAVGYFGILKTLHLRNQQFWWP